MSLKIAFVTPYYDPRDIRRGSGTFYYMSRELERQGCQLSYIGPVVFREPAVVRPLRAFAKRVQKGRYITYLDPAVASALGSALAAELRGLDVDLVLTNDPGVAAGLDVPFPLVYYSDVMLPVSGVASELRRMFAYRQVPLWALRRYQKTMRRCLERAALAIFPARWQLEQAKGYGVDPAKLRLVSFGANIPDPGPEVAEIRQKNAPEIQKLLKFLFVGRDWFEKGGDVALKTVERLRNAGVNAQLEVVGATLTDPPDYVQVHGNLNKANAQDSLKLNDLFRESYFLIFPSRHEGSAITPREAAAYGLPTLAYRIEGMLTSVIDRQSGVLLEPGTGPEGFAEVILDLFNNPGLYWNFCEGARQFYETNANWAVSVRKLIKELELLLTTKKQ
ncbi:MAG: glycosyltransferase family 4 protein [Anaerolineaceae bacterium]|nr:glycosyltransferase family 4 protein [Anaerolineaceae bacterium]